VGSLVGVTNSDPDGAITITGPLQIDTGIYLPPDRALTQIPDGSFAVVDFSPFIVGGELGTTIEFTNFESKNYTIEINWVLLDGLSAFDADGGGDPAREFTAPDAQRLTTVFETVPGMELSEVPIEVTVRAPKNIFLINSDDDPDVWNSFPVTDTIEDHTFTYVETVQVLSLAEVAPPLETPDLPAPRFVLFAASFELPSSDATVAEPPPIFVDASSAASSTSGFATREYVLRIIFADGESEEYIPLGDTLNLTEIAKKLPDERYHILFRHEDGTLESVKKIVVRDGKPYDWAEEDEGGNGLQQEEAFEESQTDETDRAADERGPGEDHDQAESPTDSAPNDVSAEPAVNSQGLRRADTPQLLDEEPADLTSDTLGRVDAVARGGLLLTAAVMGSAARARWERQADEAMKKCGPPPMWKIRRWFGYHEN
jgi:hypothetical protein